eukprot:GHVN01067376.1.p1 GENE.GHVN01067376.1~~GHVN01067376.1.p1  ORF type:complete len:141 (+),score=16.20 GHVN01067376.1:167-589(+)
MESADLDLYRGTAVLLALEETLNDLVTEQFILQEVASKIYDTAAKATFDALRKTQNHPSACRHYHLRGQLEFYRYNRRQWVLHIHDASFTRNAIPMYPGGEASMGYDEQRETARYRSIEGLKIVVRPHKCRDDGISCLSV